MEQINPIKEIEKPKHWFWKWFDGLYVGFRLLFILSCIIIAYSIGAWIGGLIW